MTAILSIDMELLQPVSVTSVATLLQLHSSQVGRVSIRLSTVEEDGVVDSITFRADPEDPKGAIQNLVSLSQKSQPGGTAVRIWYQGRSEEFVI